MTEKDYKLIAEAIRSVCISGGMPLRQNKTLVQVVESLAFVLKDDNSLFNYDLFFNACGWRPERGK